MDDSPRSSKRRKVSSSANVQQGVAPQEQLPNVDIQQDGNAQTTPAKGRARPARMANMGGGVTPAAKAPSTSGEEYANVTDAPSGAEPSQEQPTNTRPRRSTNGASASRKQQEQAEVIQDASTTKKPRAKRAKMAPESNAQDAVEELITQDKTLETSESGLPMPVTLFPDSGKRTRGRAKKSLEVQEPAMDEDTSYYANGDAMPNLVAAAALAELEYSQEQLSHEQNDMSMTLDPEIVKDDVPPQLQAAYQTFVRLASNPAHAGDLELLKSSIIGRLSGREALPLHGLDDEYSKVRQLVEQTVVAGEGNSMLILGSRGSGKTALVNAVLQDISAHSRDLFHVVRLTGFMQTDDKLALKEIWRQLGQEMQVAEEDAVKGSYADTLSSLLALLSHPDEHDLTVNGQNGTKNHIEGRTSRSIIFILDEFDLFTTHSRQTLLYNLFDIAQSRKAPIAVLGLTTRFDVVELLEKRVKSRFSHRHVLLTPPKTINAFREIILSALSPISDIDHHSNGTSDSLDANSNALSNVWHIYASLLLQEDKSVNFLLRHTYATTKSIQSMLNLFLVPMTLLSPTSIPSPSEMSRTPLVSPDSRVYLLPSLSELELALLISAARIDYTMDTESVNFNMAYQEYCKLIERNRDAGAGSAANAITPFATSSDGVGRASAGSKMWSRPVALSAWEHLAELTILVPALGGTTGKRGAAGAGQADVGRSGRLWKVDLSIAEITGGGIEVPSWMRWWLTDM